VFGILGEYGSGKTTLVQVISGDIVLGEEGTGNIHVKNRIQVVRPYADFFDYVTIGELIEICAEGGIANDAVAKAVEIQYILDRVGMKKQRGTYVHTLTPSEKIRLNIACALAGRPDILVFDEPTLGLEPEVAEGIRNVIASLRSEYMTIVVATASKKEAGMLCNRIAILEKGQIVALDTPYYLVQDAGLEAQVVFSTHSQARSTNSEERLANPVDPIFDSINVEQLRLLTGVSHVVYKDRKYYLTSSAPHMTAQALVSIYGKEVRELEIRQPTFEDIFS
jgi:ABC-2 type transport system ATP-binding protein